ncbi:hypothetical protein L9F63_014149, partial [Diploptera punctata]
CDVTLSENCKKSSLTPAAARRNPSCSDPQTLLLRVTRFLRLSRKIRRSRCWTVNPLVVLPRRTKVMRRVETRNKVKCVRYNQQRLKGQNVTPGMETRDSIPSDPGEWNAGHVKSWLKWSTRQFSLSPVPDPDKFPSSGTELLELSRSEFETRSGSSRSGRLLAVHLAHLRHSVTGRSTSPMQEHVHLEDDEEQDILPLSKLVSLILIY